MVIGIDGLITMGADPCCEDCDCLCFYTGMELIDGHVYPRRQS